MSVSLAWLLDGITAAPAIDAQVEDLTLDSREARTGSLFFALGGGKAHGIEFAAEAAAHGARVLLWDSDDAPTASVPPVMPAEFAVAAPVAGLKGMVGRIADRFFGRPSSHLEVIGITGTNGKTTCAYLLAQCLDLLEVRAAYVGTLGWGRLDALHVPTHTTPDVVTVHRQLAHLQAAGVRCVAMEVSSHALDQGRVDSVRFRAAAFTNLTRDHLDYHPSMEAYGAAKARLFAFPGLERLIVNVGDAFGRQWASAYGGGVPLTAVWVGEGVAPVAAARSLYAAGVGVDLRGISLHVCGSLGDSGVTTHLLGRFNAENSLVVLACLEALDVPLEQAVSALAACRPPPGRMEVVGGADTGKPLAVIDYAHTPDALRVALSALREHCAGDLWCVFGCGGDRDAGKRALMGAIADTLADHIIVTDDNPRTENPDDITRAIAAAIVSHEARVIHERGAAIAAALGEARPADIVLIAGKGHEDYQIYGDGRRSFSDRDAALKILRSAA